jgi:hypothetical protein
MSNNTTPKTILDLARSQLGVKEDPAGSNAVIYNTVYYGKAVSGRAYPWCAAFLWWLFHVAGASALYYGGKRTASSTALMNYYKKQGQFVTSDYRPGDIVFFSWSGSRTKADHAGIIESADGKSLMTIEGNTSSESDDNGGSVMRRNRPLSVVLGAGRPAYKEGIETDIANLNQAELTALWDRLLERFRDNDSAEWSAEGRQWSVDNGIIQGDSSDGAPNYQWEAPLTREQLAVILYRFAQFLGKA